MNRKGIYWVLLLLGAGRLLAGCSKNPHRLYTTLQDQAEVRQLKQFVAEKKSQANAATNEAVPGFAPFFAAAEKGDWLAVSNDFEELRAHAGQYSHAGNADDERLRGPRWEAVKEIWGAFDAFSEGEEKYTAAFARDIIVSIPAGSVYFGGTDPGRFVVTALCPSQVTGDPFFVLTQNALADGPYLDYLRQIYGNQLRLPDKSQALQCFQEYTAEHGKTQVSGQVSVMGINGLLAKNIFDQNPGREFYLEESFPLDWMYPQLEPHGLILKIDRQAMATLPTEVVQADHDYWAK